MLLKQSFCQRLAEFKRPNQIFEEQGLGLKLTFFLARTLLKKIFDDN